MKQTLRLRGELCPKTKLNTNLLYTIYIAFTIILVSCVCTRAQVSASSQEAGPAAEAVSEIKPLKIGDTIPDALWNMPLQMIKAGQEGITTVTLNDYKGKLIILDFWAIWCGGCISAFPKLRGLQNEFKNDISIISVGYDGEKKIKNFVNNPKKNAYLRESIVNVPLLKAFFPHRYIPHYVWIYEGAVLAFTESREVNDETIKGILTGEDITFHQKTDVLDFNRFHPFSTYWEGLFKKHLLGKTILTGYVDGIGRSGVRTFEDDSATFRQAYLNTPLIDIYNRAVQKPWNFFINEAHDKSIFENTTGDPYWYLDNLYCYEFIVPGDMPEKRIRQMVVGDLNAKLGLNVRVEKRMIACYILVRDPSLPAGDSTVTASRLKGKSLEQIVRTFNNHRKTKNNIQRLNPILVNEIKGSGKYTPPPFDTFEIAQFNEAMQPQGIRAIPAQRELEVCIISEF